MPIKIAYWSIRGLAAPLRMMAEYSGADYEAVCYDVKVTDPAPKFDLSSWFGVKPQIKEKNPLANLPYLEDTDGVVVTQSNACFAYLGAKLGLLGRSPLEKVQVDQLLCEVMDLRNACVKVYYGGAASEVPALCTNASLEKLEAWLAAKGAPTQGPFLVGATPTAPDFHLWELLDQLKVICAHLGCPCWDVANAYPRLAELYASFKKLPQLAGYFESPLSKLPINNKMACVGADPSGGPMDFAAPATWDPCEPSVQREVKNAAFVFVKPHAATPETVALVKGYLAGKGIQVVSEGVITAEEIDSKKLIDQHYYAIASKATILKPKELNVPSDKFEAQFGLSWEAALAQGNVYNAMDACEKLGLTADEMDAQWGRCKKAKKLVKFGGGFYCGLIEIEGKPSLYVFNGFFMSMRSKFTAPGEKIHYFSVEWASEQLGWADFRSKALGPTDPADAPPSSLRGMVASGWQGLGLGAAPDVGDNGVHASASPFEALAERMNWLGVSEAKADPFGRACLDAGLDAETLKKWSVDPQVSLPEGGKGSLFDACEDLDARACLERLKQIKAFE